jgi:hypothetical protein
MEHMLLWVPPGLLRFTLPLVLLAAGNIFAQTIPSSPATPPETARERTLLAERYAAERLSVWQKRLNLQDWNISLLVVRAAELKPKTLGNIHWDADKKTAVIRVLDPADYKLPFSEMLSDLEFTVVHELIHLELSPVLSPLQRNDANRREEEHAVNHMADALLRLDRQNRALTQLTQQQPPQQQQQQTAHHASPQH